MLLVTLLYRKAWYTQWCQPLEISNLEIFFSDQHPPCNCICWWDSPQENFFFICIPYPPSPPPPPEQCCEKNMDLSVRELNRLNTHLIRLSLISDWQRKDSSFCLQQTTCIMQENEARNCNTSIRSQMILEFENIWSLNLSFLWATDSNFLLSGSFGHLYARAGDWLCNWETPW